MAWVTVSTKAIATEIENMRWDYRKLDEVWDKTNAELMRMAALDGAINALEAIIRSASNSEAANDIERDG